MLDLAKFLAVDIVVPFLAAARLAHSFAALAQLGREIHEVAKYGANQRQGRVRFRGRVVFFLLLGGGLYCCHRVSPAPLLVRYSDLGSGLVASGWAMSVFAASGVTEVVT